MDETGADETEAGLSSLVEGVDPARAYVASLAAAVVGLVGGSLLFPMKVYAGFVWQYFWGPVYADANGYHCAVWDGGARTLLTAGECSTAEGIVAVKGYTVVNEIGYALTLVFAVVGLVMLLRRLDVGKSRKLFYGLLPFMFLGGALRVVEDVDNRAVEQGIEPMLSYPANSLIISPVIYFTVFFLTLATLVAAIYATRRGLVEDYHRPLFGVGAAVLGLNMLYLLYLAPTTDYVHFYPQVLVAVLAIAGAVTWVTWHGIERYRPGLNAGTGLMGAVIIFGHAVDGVANVVGLDWYETLTFGEQANLVGKHPVNRGVVDLSTAVLPESVTQVIGTAWPFLLLKIVVVLFVLAIFDETVFEESPRYAILMLVAVLAVGLGPGTRDMLRATFGV